MLRAQGLAAAQQANGENDCIVVVLQKDKLRTEVLHRHLRFIAKHRPNLVVVLIDRDYSLSRKSSMPLYGVSRESGRRHGLHGLRDFAFTIYEPISAYDRGALVAALRSTRICPGPVILPVEVIEARTQSGKSDGSAETLRLRADKPDSSECTVSDESAERAWPRPETDFDLNESRTHAREVHQRPLPAELLSWVIEYERVGRRSRYLWHWCAEGMAFLTLPCVDSELSNHCLLTKMLGVMWDVMIDDAADQEQDACFLRILLDRCDPSPNPIPSELPAEKRAYVAFTERLWQAIQERARSYPRFDEFSGWLRFDYDQLMNAVRYAVLVNRDVQAMNLVEHDLYLPHNMHIMISGTFDLMCSSGFDRRELGAVRSLLWHTECMGRVGNLLSTWERELEDGDFTSGVFAWALERGAVTLEQLQPHNRLSLRDAIRRSGCRAHFLHEWTEHRQQVLGLCDRIQSFDVRAVLAAFEKLLSFELDSRGLK